jgi:hypothetical protein
MGTAFVILAVVMLAILLGPLLMDGSEILKALRGGSEAHRKADCQNHLKRIGLALQNYLSVYGTFPPAYIADSHGRLMHSWRVLILPYAEKWDNSSHYQEIYDAYDFSEPWDGPDNRRLLERMPDIYRCPSDSYAPPGTTNYVAVIGNETAWPFSASRAASEFTDGLATTLLVVETTDRNIPWLAPIDLDFTYFDPRINPPSKYGIASQHAARQRWPGGAMALIADGAVRYFDDKTDPALIRALLTVAGGEPVTFP